MKRSAAQANLAASNNDSKRPRNEGTDGALKPVPLVQVDAHGKYVMPPEGRKMLESILSPFAFVGIAGTFRGGKSYLMNALRAAHGRKIAYQQRQAVKPTGDFQVDESINACTKGIWLHPVSMSIQRSIPTNPVDEMQFYFLDTEGFGDVAGKDAAHDLKIFSLLLLITELFLFNSSGPINESALRELSLVSEVTKKIQIDAGKTLEEKKDDGGAGFFPDLLWVCRNFNLEMKTSEGKSCTADEYLENVVSSRPGEALDSEKNKMRSSLRTVFPRRFAITMPFPCSNPDDIKRLSSHPAKATPEFKAKVDECLVKMMNVMRPKTVNGRVASGRMMAALLDNYLNCINTGSVPVIKDIWSTQTELQCRDALDDNVRRLDKWAVEQAKIGTELMDLEQLEQQAQVMIHQLTEQLKERLSGPEDVQNAIKTRWSAHCQERQQQWLKAQEARMDEKLRHLQVEYIEPYLKTCKTMGKTLPEFLDCFDRAMNDFYSRCGRNRVTQQMWSNFMLLPLRNWCIDHAESSSLKIKELQQFATESKSRQAEYETNLKRAQEESKDYNQQLLDQLATMRKTYEEEAKKKEATSKAALEKQLQETEEVRKKCELAENKAALLEQSTKHEIDDWKEKHLNSQTALKEMEQQHMELKSEWETLTQTHAVVKMEAEQVAVLKSQLSDAQSQMARSEQRYKAMVEEAANTQEELIQQQTQLQQECQNVMQQRAQEIKQVQDAYAKMQREHEEMKHSAKMEQEKWQNELRQTTTNWQEFKKRVEEDQNRLKEDKQSLQNQMLSSDRRFAEEKKVLDQRIEKLETEVNESQRAKQDVERQLNSEKHQREILAHTHKYELEKKDMKQAESTAQITKHLATIETMRQTESKSKLEMEKLRVDKKGFEVELDLVRKQLKLTREEDEERIAKLQKDNSALTLKVRLSSSLNMLAGDPVNGSGASSFMSMGSQRLFGGLSSTPVVHATSSPSSASEN